jgi:hypothetical protein
MRRAGVLAAIVFWQSRHGENAQPTAERALEELAAVNKSELDDEDRIAFADPAVRVGASRLAALPATGRGGRLIVRTAPGAAGETCVMLFDARHDNGEPLIRHCTFGTVWTGSAMGNVDGTALTLGPTSGYLARAVGIPAEGQWLEHRCAATRHGRTRSGLRRICRLGARLSAAADRA